MLKPFQNLIAIVFVLGVLFCVFFTMTPHFNANESTKPTQFSVHNALEKVKTITTAPHYVGAPNHNKVINILLQELNALGLQPQIQEGFIFSEGGTLVKAKNIIAKIKGSNTTKALVLLSHYDSAPHSKSLGASDDASGIATILESVRAYKAANLQPKNDILIVFTDGEEIGLNGAALFVTEHKWAKEVGLVLNLEARGSSGPSYMLMETNNGNAQMVNAFAAAKISFPASNSLMYSIYKMLPNDTDLTVFREMGGIQGYNFAFIDNHFNYHTVQDNYKNLDRQSLAHQGNYLHTLLTYFANTDISSLNSNNDRVYFTIPYAFINYPFGWIYPLVALTALLLCFFIYLGFRRKIFTKKGLWQGFLVFFIAMALAGLLTYFGWNIILKIYPAYTEIQHGFTYNGHDYIYAFISLSMSICFFIYHFRMDQKSENIAPLVIWFFINMAIAFFLKGASFFIIPLFSSSIMLGSLVLTQKSVWWLNLIAALPTLCIFPPLIQMLPIGLGLKILAGSAVLTVLTFGLLLPIFNSFSHKNKWAYGLFALFLFFLAKAHYNAGFSEEKAKPNSMVYLYNANENKAYWATYDNYLDTWTKQILGNNPEKATLLNQHTMYSKYNSNYTYMKSAPIRDIQKPTIQIIRNEHVGNSKFYKIKISPNRKVNRYNLFSNGTTVQNLVANGVKALNIKSKIMGKANDRLLSYYVTDNFPLTIEFSIPASEKLNLELKESSFDLMENKTMNVPKREKWMMPKPFVLTDAVIISQTIQSE